MKFFPDENFPRPALTQLQAAGHSGMHALETFPPGIPDDRLLVTDARIYSRQRE